MNTKNKIINLINEINQFTGKSDTNLSEAVDSCIEIPSEEFTQQFIARTISKVNDTNGYVGEIASNSFGYCNNLTEVNFPYVYRIYHNAFLNCVNLETVKLGGGSVCALNHSNAFSGCTNLQSIYVPSSLYYAYQSATNWAIYEDKFVRM